MADRDEPPIRHAATLIAGREAAGGGLEILVVERAAGSRFLPGYVAFPGGAVDDDDDVAAVRWFGDPHEASRAAAVRELEEETGIALSVRSVADLPQVCHWVAPPDVPVRFDARYFAVAADAGPEPVPDGGETAAAWWVSPRVLMDGWGRGERKLYWPTWYTMTYIAMCASVADLLALRFETRDPTPQEEADLPLSVMEQEA